MLEEVALNNKNWKSYKLEGITEFKNGLNFQKKQKGDKGILIVDVLNMYGNNIYVDMDKFYRVKFEKDISSDHLLKKGDILFVRSSLKREGIGWASLFNGFSEPVSFCGFIIRARIDEAICLPEYLIYFLRSQRTRANIVAFAGQVAISNVTQAMIGKLKIPLPPLPEQKKIAEILSTVDLAIENVDRGIIKIERIKKTLTCNLFTYGLRNKGTKTLKIGKIPKEWKISLLYEIAKVRYGLGQPPLKKDKGIPMIRATNIKEGKIFFKDLLFIDPKDIPDSRNPFLKENDIIVVRSGAYTGDVAHITQEWKGSVAGYDLIITPSENINPKYLSLFLLSNKIQKRYFGTLKERSAQPHLNSHQLEMTPIVYPTLVEQKQVAEIITAIEQKQELLEKRKLGLLKLKKGLMNDLLTGDRRVRL